MKAASLLRATLHWPACWLALASTTAVGLLLWHLPAGAGIDSAAHAYKVAVTRAGGSYLWDGLWYSGSYGAATYGYLYYLVASHVGETPLVVAAAGSLPPLFFSYLRGVWRLDGRTAIVSAAALAATELMLLPFGEHPFFVSLALAMGAAAFVAVEYVFVGQATLEPDARGVPGLLGSSREFARVASAGRWTVFRVMHPRPIVTATSGQPGRRPVVVHYGRTELDVRIARAGEYRVRESWSPYWSVSGGPASLWRAPGDWMDLRAYHAGLSALSGRLEGVLKQLF